MTNIEIIALCLGWAATCAVSFAIGYMVRKAEEAEE